MKKCIMILIWAFIPSLLMAQAAGGMITRQKTTEKSAQKSSQKTVQKIATKKNQNLSKEVIHDSNLNTSRESDNNSMNKKNNTSKVEDAILVRIKCNVPHAHLYVDGKLLGNAEGQYKIKEGSHIFRLSADDYEMLRLTTNVSSQNSELSFNMKELKAKESSTIYIDMMNDGLKKTSDINNNTWK